MTDIINLKDANSEPNANVVEILETALEQAKSGELRSVAMVGKLIDHQTLTAFEGYDSQELIGAVSFLHHTLCARQREFRTE